ncbi:acetolactate synthase 3 large subunit, partial [Rhizobium ruizarguesonis]
TPATASGRAWWLQIDHWRAHHSFSYERLDHEIMPQHALERLHALTKPHDQIIATEIGQQMWVAQFFGFDKPNRWITSGGL